MKISIYGTGYVGLVTGACLAEMGNHVLCMDIDQTKINALRHGTIPIYEPGLEEMVRRNMQSGRLLFSADVDEAVDHGLFQYIAVGTPSDEDGSADLSHVLAVARSVADSMSEYRLIVNKSTVPVGTTDKVRQVVEQQLSDRGVEVEFDVASNPEFLKEGAAIDDFMKPDRIIVGTDSGKALELLRELYAPFNRDRKRVIDMDVRSAELTKYAANAMLATKISFMNEMASIAERLGADIEMVRHGIGSDSRIGYSFIYPGCGYGGSCFPKDVQALLRTAREVDFGARLIQAVEDVNEHQKQLLFKKIFHHFDCNLAGRVIALWGLSFKPNTDDLREAPSRVLMETLWGAGAVVRAFDPVASKKASQLYSEQIRRGELVLTDSPIEAAKDADALAIVTEWKVFRSPAFEQLRKSLKTPVVFDGRNMFDPEIMSGHGFIYYAIGRGTPSH